MYAHVFQKKKGWFPMFYANTNGNFGDTCVMQASSADEIADEMQSCFEDWANDAYGKYTSDFIEDEMSYDEFVKNYVSECRDDFIDGLVEGECMVHRKNGLYILYNESNPNGYTFPKGTTIENVDEKIGNDIVYV